MSLSIREARVVVALDFGTTFSGFAYAHKALPNDVYKFYEWPDSSRGGGMPYCKTHTGLYYVPAAEEGSKKAYELKDWGWTALMSYGDALQQVTGAHGFHERRLRRNSHLNQPPPPQVGAYITKFKLLLAGEENVSSSVGGLTAEDLPSGLTAERCITDYLGKISTFILHQLKKKFGDQLTMRELQWCLTVPAIWDDKAKQKMKKCAEKAGMVSGASNPKDAEPSPHPLMIILEPEAAFLYCWTKSKHLGLDLEMNDHFLVADIGGGTTDIVVHAKISNGSEIRVKEVESSSGGLVGGTNVDMNFLDFMRREIGCFDEFTNENAALLLKFQGLWQKIKTSFNGNESIVHELNLPSKLARAWKSYEDSKGVEPRSSGYEELLLKSADIKGIFDPVVDEIIRLIRAKMSEQVKVLMVVGGFSESPYLMKRITEAFHHRVDCIINPCEAGCAICHGAVLMGLNSSRGIVSRISRKTYGVKCVTQFKQFVHPRDLRFVGVDGRYWCGGIFDAFVHKGSQVETDHCETKVYFPVHKNQRAMQISVFSCRTDAIPKYVREEGMVREGEFSIDMSDNMELGLDRRIRVSMYFGRSSIEVWAQRDNFGDTNAVEKLPVLLQFNPA